MKMGLVRRVMGFVNPKTDRDILGDLLDLIRGIADVEYEFSKIEKGGCNLNIEDLEKKRFKLNEKAIKLGFPNGSKDILNPYLLLDLEPNGVFYIHLPTEGRVSIILAKIDDKGTNINMFGDSYRWYVIETETSNFKGVDNFENWLLPKELRKLHFSYGDRCVIDLTNLKASYGYFFDRILESYEPEGATKLFSKYILPYLIEADEKERYPKKQKDYFISKCMIDDIKNALHIHEASHVTPIDNKEELKAHLLTVMMCEPDQYVYRVLFGMYSHNLCPNPDQVFNLTLDELINVNPSEIRRMAEDRYRKEKFPQPVVK